MSLAFSKCSSTCHLAPMALTISWGVVPANSAGHECHLKLYQLRPRKWGSEPGRSVRSSSGPILALSGSVATPGCLRLDSDHDPHTSPRADRVRDQSGYVLWPSHTR